MQLARDASAGNGWTENVLVFSSIAEDQAVYVMTDVEWKAEEMRKIEYGCRATGDLLSLDFVSLPR